EERLIHRKSVCPVGLFPNFSASMAALAKSKVNVFPCGVVLISSRPMSFISSEVLRGKVGDFSPAHFPSYSLSSWMLFLYVSIGYNVFQSCLRYFSASLSLLNLFTQSGSFCM